jgi:uncharacterized protein (DUF1778 family)
MARPKTAEGAGLRNFTVRLSVADRKEIEAAAAHIGLNPSEYVRRCALKKSVRVVPDERKPDPDLLRSLLAIGNNLNQIARKLNATDQAPANLNDALDTFTAFMKAHLPPRDESLRHAPKGEGEP